MTKPFPIPPRPKEDSKLTDDEAMFLIQQYLRPDQYADPKIIKFIMHYFVSRSNPDAAEAAGFPRNKGSYLRAKPEIHAAIEALTAKAVMKYGYDASEMVERAKEIANLDPIDFQNPDGSFKTHMSEIRPEARRAIKKFKAKNIFGSDANGMPTIIGQLIEVELWDKLKGIEMLGSEKNIFKKTTVVQHDVTTNMQSLLLESTKRADERKLLNARDVTQETLNEEDKKTDRAREDGRDGGVLCESIGGREIRRGESVIDLKDVFGEEQSDTSGEEC